MMPENCFPEIVSSKESGVIKEVRRRVGWAILGQSDQDLPKSKSVLCPSSFHQSLLYVGNIDAREQGAVAARGFFSQIVLQLEISLAAVKTKRTEGSQWSKSQPTLPLG